MTGEGQGRPPRAVHEALDVLTASAAHQPLDITAENPGSGEGPSRRPPGRPLAVSAVGDRSPSTPVSPSPFQAAHSSQWRRVCGVDSPPRRTEPSSRGRSPHQERPRVGARPHKEAVAHLTGVTRGVNPVPYARLPAENRDQVLPHLPRPSPVYRLSLIRWRGASLFRDPSQGC